MASRKCNPVGGVGVVDPDGDSSARAGAAIDAGESLDKAQPAPRPEKLGLCGQPEVGYYSADPGKSFNPIIDGVKYTSYEVAPKRALPWHVVEARIRQGRKLRAMYRSLGWSRADRGDA